MMSKYSFLTVGSPPVSHILSTPAFTNRLDNFFISYHVNIWSLGVNSIPSAGMQ